MSVVPFSHIPIKDRTVVVSKCCNSSKEGHSTYGACSYCGENSYHEIKPEYKLLKKGIWRRIEYRLKTRHVLIEKFDKPNLGNVNAKFYFNHDIPIAYEGRGYVN
jgi:hypothetical protein